MSECLKLLYDLAQLSGPMNVTFLRHFFSQYDPSVSRSLRETILHFHMRELEASDYRSAYHQFCDWLYGWNVSDAAEYADMRGSIAEYLRMRRVPRDIDIQHDRERVECVRLMKTFETLCSVSRRHLKKFYMDIEAEMPRLGQGLDTLSTHANKRGRKGDDGRSGGTADSDEDGHNLDDDVERVWAKSPSTENMLGELLEEEEDGKLGMDDDEDGGQGTSSSMFLRRARNKRSGDANQEDDGQIEDGNDEEDDEDEETDDKSGSKNELQGGKAGADETDAAARQINSRGMIVRRRSRPFNGRDDDGQMENKNGQDGQEFGAPGNTQNGLRTGGALVAAAADGDDSLNSSRTSSTEFTHPARHALDPKAPMGASGQPGFAFLNAPSPAANSTSTGAASDAGASTGPTIQAGTMVEASFFGLADNIDDARRALQRDVNHVFAEVDRCTEYTLVCVSSMLVVLTFAEMLQEKETFAKYCNLAHELSMDFVSNTLKTTWDLLNREIPGQVTLASLRDPIALRDLLKKLLELRAVNGRIPKYRMRKLFFKFATLHDVFRAVDIHVFPNFVAGHREGTKCAKSSAFDSNLWLTGGHDCVIRISDIRPANGHICLAQYVGHKSIVTDVHFTKNDSQIVSSSFDRTIKIWNSQQATVERTLVGHSDAVTSCDVSPDGRYIASGSTDCTVRFWDFASGESITVIRKHTRWVKVVRFSPDGRHLATAGLDRRVYIWDTKILANSRSPTHSRCIDSFADYVLDMALFRPSLLLATARDATVRLFDYMSGHELASVNLSPSWACSVAFSENGEYFATGSFDNNVVVFRTRDFTKVREIRVFNLGIMCVKFPKDLSYVVVGTTEGFLQQIPL